ncbi:hypothetical protein ElyMa_004441000 [Elysia marginata]|uniref:Uncharacterized protein n=1 Tax=Elysia marginata TaxID=1093978 RepID=A0AAV4HH41_9GAST|nr:hypothetical protein ElyMa_004441000 [Elysia marginata]
MSEERLFHSFIAYIWHVTAESACAPKHKQKVGIQKMGLLIFCLSVISHSTRTKTRKENSSNMDGKPSRRPSKPQCQHRKPQRTRVIRNLPMPNLPALNYPHLHYHHHQKQQPPLQICDANTSRKPPGQGGDPNGNGSARSHSRHKTCDSNQTTRDAGEKASTVLCDNNNNNITDRTKSAQDSEHQLNPEPLQNQSEDTALASPSPQQPGLNPVDQRVETTGVSQPSDRDTTGNDVEHQASKSLTNSTPVATGNNDQKTATSSDSASHIPAKNGRRSKSSYGHGRRRSFHENRGALFYPPIFPVPPPNWMHCRQKDFGDASRQAAGYSDQLPHRGEGTSNRICQPSDYILNLQNLREKPHTRPENWERMPIERLRANTTGPAQTRSWSLARDNNCLADISGSSLPESDMWMNGYPMPGYGNAMHGQTFSHDWRGPVRNHYGGNTNNHGCRHNNNHHHQDPRRRLSEVPNGRHRKYAVGSPGFVQNDYTEGKYKSRGNERVLVEHGPRTNQGRQLPEYHSGGRSRYDQFLFSADHPPPPFPIPHVEKRQAMSPDIINTEELPRYIGDILNSRGESVEAFRRRQRRGFEPFEGAKRRGNEVAENVNHSSSVQSFHNTQSQNSKPEVASESHCLSPKSTHFYNERDASAVCSTSHRDSENSYNSRIKTFNKTACDSELNRNQIQRKSLKNRIHFQDFPNEIANNSSQGLCHQSDYNSTRRFSKKAHQEEYTDSENNGERSQLKSNMHVTQQQRCPGNVFPDLTPLSAILSERSIEVNLGQGVAPHLGDADAPVYEQEISGETTKRPQASAVADAHEDLLIAQEIGLPIKNSNNNKKSDLNPSAEEFAPVHIRDGSGNMFTMTQQKGVCFFRPLSGAEQFSSDPRYVIQNDKHLSMNGSAADVGDQQLASVQPETAAEHVFNPAASSATVEGHVESPQTFVQNQQQPCFIPDNHQHQGQNLLPEFQPHVLYQPSSAQQQQQEHHQRLPCSIVPLMDQPFTPIIPVANSVFAFPGQMPIEMNMVTPSQEFQLSMSQRVPCEFPQGNNYISHFHQTNFNQENHVFPASQPNNTLIPSISNISDVQVAGTPQAAYIDVPRTECIPLFHLSHDIGGMIPPPVTNIPQTPVSAHLAPPGIHGNFTPAHQGHVIFPSHTSIPGNFNPTMPVYHQEYHVDTTPRQAEKTERNTHQSLEVHNSSAVTSVGLHDTPNEEDIASLKLKQTVDGGKDEQSLYEKVKDTLQEVRKSLRPRDSTEADVDKPIDSEDNRQLNNELSKILNKLSVLNRCGNKAALQRDIANAPENMRPTLDLMLRFLDILSEEPTGQSPENLSTLVCIFKGLTSGLPTDLTQTLLKLLPEVGSKTDGKGVYNSSLDQLILKSMKDPSKTNEQSPSDHFQQNSDNAIYGVSCTPQSNSQCTSITGDKKISHPCDGVVSAPDNKKSDLNTSQSRDGGNGTSYLETRESRERGVNPDAALSDRLGGDNTGAQISQNGADQEDSASKEHQIGRSSPAMGPGVETRLEKEFQSRHGTPHPTPRQRSVQRASRCDVQSNTRSPAFDKVDIASRIGVFERMRSKR